MTSWLWWRHVSIGDENDVIIIVTSRFDWWRHIYIFLNRSMSVKWSHDAQLWYLHGNCILTSFWRSVAKTSSLFPWRSVSVYPSDFERRDMLEFDWKAFVRSGIRTHASNWRPEHSLTLIQCKISWVWRLRPLGHPDLYFRRALQNYKTSQDVTRLSRNQNASWQRLK